MFRFILDRWQKPSGFREDIREEQERPSWEIILGEASRHALLYASPVHGVMHWRGVAATGLDLCGLSPVSDPDIVLAFAIVHDCCRVDEMDDPEHGSRAAHFVERSATLLNMLGEERTAVLSTACRFHNKGTTTSCPTVGACWDADRYNLLRLDRKPGSHLLSLRISPEDRERTLNSARHYVRQPPDWPAILQKHRDILSERQLTHPAH